MSLHYIAQWNPMKGNMEHVALIFDMIKLKNI